MATLRLQGHVLSGLTSWQAVAAYYRAATKIYGLDEAEAHATFRRADQSDWAPNSLGVLFYEPGHLGNCANDLDEQCALDDAANAEIAKVMRLMPGDPPKVYVEWINSAVGAIYPV